MNLREAVDYACNTAKRTGKPQVIARKGEHMYQVRISFISRVRGRGKEIKRVVEGRRWEDVTIATHEAGWARWSTFLGFSVDSVLAQDWNLVEAWEVAP